LGMGFVRLFTLTFRKAITPFRQNKNRPQKVGLIISLALPKPSAARAA